MARENNEYQYTALYKQEACYIRQLLTIRLSLVRSLTQTKTTKFYQC